MQYYAVNGIDASEFTGDLTPLIAEDGETVRVQHSMRGYFLRYADKSLQPIKLGDYIITYPVFKIVPGKIFLERFRPCASQGESGEK